MCCFSTAAASEKNNFIKKLFTIISHHQLDLKKMLFYFFGINPTKNNFYTLTDHSIIEFFLVCVLENNPIDVLPNFKFLYLRFTICFSATRLVCDIYIYLGVNNPTTYPTQLLIHTLNNFIFRIIG